ncbi:hypothetical protein D3C71_1774200 [compost metagenome]
MLSLIIFAMVFGNLGKSFIWAALEPVFQQTWEERTLNDGRIVNEKLTEQFNSIYQVTD